jgi:two-component system, sensor histidine kinase PdtaS
VTTPAELALTCTDLTPSQLGHVQRLLGSWSVLADLSFSDLLLVVPTSSIPGEAPELVVMGQIRPSNRPTLIGQDLVGLTMTQASWPLVSEAFRRQEVVRGTLDHPTIGDPLTAENVPVRVGDEVVAVMVRVYSGTPHAPVSLYEKTYLAVFERLVTMLTQSAFPFPDADVGTEETPRVGDGFVLVDAKGQIEFASPNAVNAFHRMGIYAAPEGTSFRELGMEESAVEWALASGRPMVEEVERRPDVVVLVQSIPLIDAGETTGAAVLTRDVTDVRRLDRLLLSKDAAIREVHHRIKNNLQTISSLLSLQGRRLPDGEGREALREAERRVRSIALVHEVLSRDPGDQVPFGEIVDSLVRMAEDSVVSSRPVEIEVEGDLGGVTADVATPLAVTLAEILQNAVEHAFSEGPSAPEGHAAGGSGVADPGKGHVSVSLGHGREGLSVVVRDDGRGLYEGFDIERTSSLGLAIVRDLVVSQLGGSITMGAAAGGGTEVVILLPVGRA